MDDDAEQACPTARDPWTVHHFTQGNPHGPGQGDVGAALRRLADTIDELGDIDVQDITYSSEVTDGEDQVTFTVYYHRQPRRR
jgi:hypothetical protein